jgi:hypothetical protein
MPETLADKLAESTLKDAVLQNVASDDLDQIPPDFDDESRFVVCAVRSVATRTAVSSLCAFVYSEAPVKEGQPLGFERVLHMQDGYGEMDGKVVLTGRDANNGAYLNVACGDVAEFFSELERLGVADRPTVVWDGTARVATVYPSGTTGDASHARFQVPENKSNLTQDDVCEILNKTYEENLKNPSAHTARLWTKGKLVGQAEDEIERHLKGQVTMYFAGQSRPVRLLSQTDTVAGRTDLQFLQKLDSGGPRLMGVLELKVLRGPLAADRVATEEGLSQGFHYRDALEVPFATLALYDVAEQPSDDAQPLLTGQNSKHVNVVRVRRFPLFNSPKAWRDAQNKKAA